MDAGTLLDAAKDTPWLLSTLVVGLGVVYLAERLFALSGPITKVLDWWRGRTLTKLRREALIRAEQRRIEREERAAEAADLSHRLADLQAEVEWLREERADQRRRDRVRDGYDRRMSAYVFDLAARARASGMEVDDPPRPPDLAPLLVEEDTAPMRRVRNHARPPVPAR